MTSITAMALLGCVIGCIIIWDMNRKPSDKKDHK
ncbi:Uncharacterised protein [Suttonella ornithocola]|uniref:Uncharacterized protein n=1 Tax=Suttonella ornithocola TaxID=279832 RepID=A0A380MX58_9GAMM|nr:Uncharacterised protein [Suttonella ornithocola]